MKLADGTPKVVLRNQIATLRSRHLLGIEELTPDEIRLILDTAVAMKEVGTRSIKKVPALRGRTVVNLFYESSTRTSSSFELAAKRLSADVVSVKAAGSSVDKGESLKDTIRTLNAYKPNIIVILSDDYGYGSANCYGAPTALVLITTLSAPLIAQLRSSSDALNRSGSKATTRSTMRPRAAVAKGIRARGVPPGDSRQGIRAAARPGANPCRGGGGRAIGPARAGAASAALARWKLMANRVLPV